MYSFHLQLKNSTDPSGRLDHASPGIASITSRASSAAIACEEGTSAVAMPGLYVHRAFLMEQEFLKLRDHQPTQPASFQAIGNGKRFALSKSVFEREIDDAKD